MVQKLCIYFKNVENTNKQRSFYGNAIKFVSGMHPPMAGLVTAHGWACLVTAHA